MADISLSAFSLFFIESESFLSYQRRLDKRHGASKKETYEWFTTHRHYVEVFRLPPYWPELNATARIWN
jgi:hypothetical protein